MAGRLRRSSAHCAATSLAARGESLASHRDGRGAPPARRDDREYREYLSEEQRSRWGCIARRMQPDFHHGLLAPLPQIGASRVALASVADPRGRPLVDIGADDFVIQEAGTP